MAGLANPPRTDASNISITYPESPASGAPATTCPASPTLGAPSTTPCIDAPAQDPHRPPLRPTNPRTTSSSAPNAPTAPRSSCSPLQQLPPELLARIALAAGRHCVAPLCKHLSALLATAAPPTTLQPIGRTTTATFDTAFPSTIARHASTLTTLDLSHLGYLLTPAHLPLLSPASLPHLSSLTLRRYRLLHPPRPLDTLPLNPTLTHLALLSKEAPVSDTCLLHICTSAPLLRSLSLLVGGVQDQYGLYRDFRRSVSALSALSCLTRLRMSSTGYNPFTTDTAAALLCTTASLPALQSLVLAPVEVVLSDAMCETLARHAQLTELAFNTCGRGEGHNIDHFSEHPSARALLVALGQLTRLRRLSLASDLEWKHMHHSDNGEAALHGQLSGLTALQSLRLTCWELDSMWPAAFPHVALTELYLDANLNSGFYQPGHPVLPLLPLAPTLKALYLGGEFVSTAMVEVVGRLTALTQLGLYCDLQEDSSAAGFRFPSLHRLAGSLKSLTLGKGIGKGILRNVESAAAVLRPLTGLTHLQLADIRMADAVLAGGGWLTGMQQLQCLCLLGQKSLVGHGLRVLRWLPHLTHVTVDTHVECDDFSDHWIQYLIPPPTRLRRVSHLQPPLWQWRAEMVELLSPYGIEVSFSEVGWLARWNDLHPLD